MIFLPIVFPNTAPIDYSHENTLYLVVAGFIEMVFEYPEYFRVPSDPKLFRLCQTFINGLSGKFLDLNVKEFAKITEPFD